MTRSRRRAEVAWARSADRDLERIYAYIGLESQKRAAGVVTRVIRAIDQLEFEPELGAVANDVEPVGRCRHLIVTPFRVIYQVEGRAVLILRIWTLDVIRARWWCQEATRVSPTGRARYQVGRLVRHASQSEKQHPGTPGVGRPRRRESGYAGAVVQ